MASRPPPASLTTRMFLAEASSATPNLPILTQTRPRTAQAGFRGTPERGYWQKTGRLLWELLRVLSQKKVFQRFICLACSARGRSLAKNLTSSRSSSQFSEERGPARCNKDKDRENTEKKTKTNTEKKTKTEKRTKTEKKTKTKRGPLQELERRQECRQHRQVVRQHLQIDQWQVRSHFGNFYNKQTEISCFWKTPIDCFGEKTKELIVWRRRGQEVADLAGRTSEQGKDYLIGLNFAKYKYNTQIQIQRC